MKTEDVPDPGHALRNPSSPILANKQDVRKKVRKMCAVIQRSLAREALAPSRGPSSCCRFTGNRAGGGNRISTNRGDVRSPQTPSTRACRPWTLPLPARPTLRGLDADQSVCLLPDIPPRARETSAPLRTHWPTLRGLDDAREPVRSLDPMTKAHVAQLPLFASLSPCRRVPAQAPAPLAPAFSPRRKVSAAALISILSEANCH